MHEKHYWIHRASYCLLVLRLLLQKSSRFDLDVRTKLRLLIRLLLMTWQFDSTGGSLASYIPYRLQRRVLELVGWSCIYIAVIDMSVTWFHLFQQIISLKFPLHLKCARHVLDLFKHALLYGSFSYSATKVVNMNGNMSPTTNVLWTKVFRSALDMSVTKFYLLTVVWTQFQAEEILPLKKKKSAGSVIFFIFIMTSKRFKIMSL